MDEPPAAQPASPAAQPASPAAQPATPAAQPASPAAQPASPAAQPAPPTAQPAPPAARPAPDLVDHGDWAANIVEKYNATAHKVFTAQGEIQQVQEEQGRCVQQLQKMAAQNQELDVKQQKAIEELQTADKDMHEAIKSLMEERLSATKAEVQKAVRMLDESLTPKFDGLERGIEDVVSMQKEIQAKTLPRWRADLGTEIQGLRTDVVHLKEQTGTRDNELAEAQAKAQTAAREAQASLESKLLAEISELKARLGKAEQAAEALALDHSKTKSNLAELDTKRAQEKVALDERFSSIERLQDSHKEAAGKMGERVDKLEKVTQQILFDFEDMKAKVTGELSFRGEQLDAGFKELEKREGDAEMHIKESFDKAKEALDKVLASEVEAMSKKIAATHDVAVENTKTGVKNADDISKVGDLLEQKCKQLEKQMEQQSKADAKEVLQTIRLDEGVRLGTLEGTVKEFQAAQLRQAEKQQQDHKTLTESINSTQSSTDQKIKDLENGSASRLKIIQQAVDELAQMFQEFGVLQQHQETNLRTLEGTVKAVEIRLWPWKTRNRSDSPSARPNNIRPISAGPAGSRRGSLGAPRAPLLDQPASASRLQDSGLNVTASTDLPASEGNFSERARAETGNPPSRLRPISAPRPRAAAGAGAGTGDREIGSSLPAGVARNPMARPLGGRLNR